MPRHLESKLQQSCVKWFDLQYPALRMNLFAIPNGGRRSKVEAGIMKGEGVRAGVADMFLAVPSDRAIISGRVYHGLFIEFKYGKGKQSPSQIMFQKSVSEQKYLYAVVSTFESFQKLVNEYLN